MSAKITISYETPEELQRILSCLQPITGRLKKAKEKKGGYDHAYIEVIRPTNQEV